MSSELNFDRGVQPGGCDVVSWGSIAGVGAGGDCNVAGFGKEYGLMMNGVVCIAKTGD